MEWFACEECRSAFPEGAVNCDTAGDVSARCGACGDVVGRCDLRIRRIELPDELADELRESIHACEQEGCGGGYYDHEDHERIGDETTVCLREALYELVEARTDEPFFVLLAALAEADDDLRRIVALPDVSCPNCGAEIDDWYTDVKTCVYESLIPRLLKPPPEIRDIDLPDLASRIEWWRSDSSVYLVHLTRGQLYVTKRDNIEYKEHKEKITASEALWSILASGELRANRGKGLRAKAVCFTEKPLAALKETIMGAEARVRRGSRSLAWAAYGVMFEKAYLRELGVRPVIHADDAEHAALPEDMRYRAVRFGRGANWLHEREWRAPGDLTFDLTKCIVLVPTFQQGELFRSTLAKQGRAARGFLPLLDVFAAL